MKRNLLILCLCLLTGISASAYNANIDGIYYIFSGDMAWVTYKDTYYNSYSGTVVIPEHVSYGGKTYTVTRISEKAFSYCNALKTVVIPNSVTRIGGSAFEFSSLTSITIPSSVFDIPINAFYYCSDLNSVTISEGVNSIGDQAFMGCESLTSITIPNSVTAIGSAFSKCINLKSVTLGNGVTTLKSTFSGCTGLTSVIIPSSVTTIQGAFYNCTGLTSIVIPNSVTTIGSSTFNGCSNLVSITIPESVTTIEASAFSRTPWYNNQPDGLIYAGRVAYQYKGDMPAGTQIKIRQGTVSLTAGTFSGCYGLTSVTIPSSVTSIGDNAFYYCTGLTDVYCYAKEVPSVNGSVFDNSSIASATLHVPEASIAQYKANQIWRKFGTIVALEDEEKEKCATPAISYAGGKLKFICETEGVQFFYDIKDDDVREGIGNDVDLTATYHISVFAAKDGCEDSDIATATLCWIDQQPDMEGITDDEDAVAEVKAIPVLIQTEGSTITVQGAKEGTDIAVYGIGGTKEGSAIAGKDRTAIYTSLQPGSVAIVKIGEKSIKVAVK